MRRSSASVVSGTTAAVLANMSVEHAVVGPRREGRFAMKRLGSLLGALTLAAVAGGVLTASPAAARATTETIHVTNVTESNPDVNPCSGATGTVSMTYSGGLNSSAQPPGPSSCTCTLPAHLARGRGGRPELTCG